MQGDTLMTEEQKQALDAVVQYNWEEELTDFTEDENESRAEHVFRHLVLLDNMLNGTDFTPESYLPGSVPVTITPEEECDIPF